MGEKIDGNLDVPSLIIERPPPPPKVYYILAKWNPWIQCKGGHKRQNENRNHILEFVLKVLGRFSHI